MSHDEPSLDPMADALDEKIASVKERLAEGDGPSAVDVAEELLDEGFGCIYIIMGLKAIFGTGLAENKGHAYEAKARIDGRVRS